MGGQTVESALSVTNVPKFTYAHMKLEATRINMITIQDQKCYAEEEVSNILKVGKVTGDSSQFH